MVNEREGIRLREVATLFDVGTCVGLSDADLLHRYLNSCREVGEVAFSVLVERHGPMVLGVCRATLGQDDDAHDAFQATFLTLARRVGSIRRRESVGPWLHGVALRVSLRLRSANYRRRTHERAYVQVGSGKDTTSEADRIDQAATLHEEIARMPERFRTVMVLCDLEGASYESAAVVLDCPVGTIKSRLARARLRLRDGLTRRGIATFLPLGKFPAISISLVDSTTRVAVTGISSLPIEHLVQGVIRIMLLKQLQVAGAAVVVMVGLTIGVGANLTANAQSDGPDLSAKQAAIRVPGAEAASELPDAAAKAEEPEIPTEETKETSATDFEARQEATLTRLDLPISIQFPQEAPLAEILKFCQSVANNDNSQPIQFYLDPVGLQEADRTETSPVKIDLEHVSIKFALKLITRQLGLAYGVNEGVVIISSQESIHALLEQEEPLFTSESPLERMIIKAERGELGEDEIDRLKSMIEAHILVEPPLTKHEGGGGFSQRRFKPAPAPQDDGELSQRIDALEKKLDRLMEAIEAPKSKVSSTGGLGTQ